MSRARDNANLGTQAGSGLTASDLTTGTLGNTVQDNITRVGTVGTGTWEGTTVAVNQGGTGVTAKTGTGNVVLSASPTFSGTPVGITASHILTGAIPAAVTGGSGLNALSASNLSAGTVPNARFPATLPAASGANLTALPAAQVGGVLPAGVTGGTGLTGHGRIGDSARSYLTTTMLSQSASTFTTGYTNEVIDNSALFEAHADGIKVLIDGTYLITWSIYSASSSASARVAAHYTQEYIAFKNNGSPDTVIDRTYVIYARSDASNSATKGYHKSGHAHVVKLNANDVVAPFIHSESGNNYDIYSGLATTFIRITYLSEHS